MTTKGTAHQDEPESAQNQLPETDGTAALAIPDATQKDRAWTVALGAPTSLPKDVPLSFESYVPDYQMLSPAEQAEADQYGPPVIVKFRGDMWEMFLRWLQRIAANDALGEAVDRQLERFRTEAAATLRTVAAVRSVGSSQPAVPAEGDDDGEPEPPRKYMSPQEYANYRGVKLWRVQQWYRCKVHPIPHESLGKRIIHIKVKEADEWIARGGSEAALRASARAHADGGK